DSGLPFFFFFSSRSRHTSSDRDWSSDVCSSDLDDPARQPARLIARLRFFFPEARTIDLLRLPTGVMNVVTATRGQGKSEMKTYRSEERRVGKEGRRGRGRDDRRKSQQGRTERNR